MKCERNLGTKHSLKTHSAQTYLTTFQALPFHSPEANERVLIHGQGRDEILRRLREGLVPDIMYTDSCSYNHRSRTLVQGGSCLEGPVCFCQSAGDQVKLIQV